MSRPELGRRALATWIPLLFCLCLFGYTCIFNNARVDDAYITASYARTLGTSGTWGMHPGFPSNAATSPLNVIVLAALVRLGMSALTAQTVLNGILIAVAFVTLRRLSRLIFASDLWAYAATALLFVNPLLVSTMGLESYFYTVITLLCCLCYFLRRFGWMGCCGLLVLARPDGVLFVLIATLLLILQWRRSLLTFFTPMLAVLLAWEGYSWRVLGSLVPDTYFIKTSQSGWRGVVFGGGFKLYYHMHKLPTLLSVFCILALPLAIRLARRNRSWAMFCGLAGGAAALHALSYSALKVPPYHWYYAQECAALVLLGSAGLIYGWEKSNVQRWAAMTAIALLTAASVAAGVISLSRRHATPISSNFASASEYRAIALWINDHSTVRAYRLDGELGVMQYYTRAEAVNEFSDRAILVQTTQPSKLPAWLRRLNTRFLRVTSEPVAAEFTGECMPGKAYQKSWITHSYWHGAHEWCWTDGDQTHATARGKN